MFCQNVSVQMHDTAGNDFTFLFHFFRDLIVQLIEHLFSAVNS